MKESLRIFKKYKGLFAGFVAFTLIATAFETVSIGLIVPLLNFILEKKTVDISGGWIINGLDHILTLLKGDNFFVKVGLFLFVLTLIKVALSILRDVFKVILSQRIKIDCHREMYEKCIYSDMKYFISNKSGDLVFRIINLPAEVSTYFTLLPNIVIEVINIAVISVFLLSVSVTYFIATFVTGIIFGLLTWVFSRDVISKAGKEVMDAASRQNIVLAETLIGIREIITYDKPQQWVGRFWEQCRRYYRNKIRSSILRLVPGSLLELFVIGGICVSGIMYGLFSSDSTENAKDLLPIFAVYALAVIRMIPSFSRISQDQTQLAAYAPALTMYEKYLSESTVFFTDGKEKVEKFENSIKFENVSFGYTPHRLIFDNLNLEIRRNKTTAIVGGSGAGKSTLIDLFLGFYDVQSGRILVDGRDMKNIIRSSWRAHSGVVAQNSTIFNASVKENIALEFKNVDMGRVRRASKAAGVEEFIGSLKEGYDTELGDRGFKLSGGQRQRIAIARALYRDPEILIFDEATSALDNRTERMIVDTMLDFAKEKTIIVLAHRLSTIEKADIIHVLKDGKVSQSGTHKELVQAHGEYSELYQREIVK